MQTVMQHPDTVVSTSLSTGNTEQASGLGHFHTIPSEEREHNVAGRIVGTIVGLAILLGGGLYLYVTTNASPPPPVANSELPVTGSIQ